MKLAIVVQRYGADINGGAELHARYIAERLAPHADVRVLTTCARDYVTWKNEFPAGPDVVNGVPVERFAVSRERDTIEFDRRSRHVFNDVHSLHDELQWLDSEGPTSPDLISTADAAARGIRFRRALQRAVLPRLPRRACGGRSRRAGADGGTRAVARLVALPAGVSRRPRDHVQLVRGARAHHTRWRDNEHVPGVVVGVGSDIPGGGRTGAGASEVRIAESVHRVRRSNRRQQGMRGAVRLLSPVCGRLVPADRSRA